jgi:Holliday junction resolvase RusA-like endonuclease
MTFTLSLPPTFNHQYGYSRNTGRKYLTEKAKAWKEEAQWIFKNLWKDEPINEPVRLVINYYLKYNRDVDGGKLIMDSLEEIVYVNDKQVVELYITKHKDKQIPRVELKVETLI